MPETPETPQGPRPKASFPKPRSVNCAEQEFLCAVSSDLFWRVWQGRARDASRLALTGVNIAPAPDGGALLTASDGHILISIRDPDALVKGSGIVRVNDILVSACKAKRADTPGTERVLMIRQDLQSQAVAVIAHVECVGEDTTRDAAFELLDQPNYQVIAVQYEDVTVNMDYPSVWRLLPSDDAVGLSGAPINAVLLKPIIDALKPYNSKTCALAFFTQAGGLPSEHAVLIKPDKFALPGGKWFEGFALIMPLRNEIVAGVPINLPRIVEAETTEEAA